MKDFLINWSSAMGIAALLALSCNLDLHGIISDRSEENFIAIKLEYEQRNVDNALQIELSAAKFCREKYGESIFTWKADKELVCIPRGYIRRKS